MAPASPFLGQVLDGRYELLNVVGVGAFSIVFEALDISTRERVAVKLLNPERATDLVAVAEFETEGELLALLGRCPNVINYTGTYATSVPVMLSGIPLPLLVRFHVLELADGSLADLLPDRDKLSWFVKLKLFRDCVSGAHQMHLQRMRHRDIKCANALVLSARPPQVNVVKLADLGRSRSLDLAPRLPPVGYALGRGDPSFAPPEYIWRQGASDAASLYRSELYLLGSLLFELATGQGLTAIAFPAEWTLAQTSPAGMYASRIATLRVDLEPALELFSQAVPKELKLHGIDLARQLCDPDPRLRTLRFRAERNLPGTGLEWLLRRVDILLRTLSTKSRGVALSVGGKP